MAFHEKRLREEAGKMYLVLLFFIYLSFVGLGLPDSILGSAWPVMRTEFGAALDFAGIISFVITLSKTFAGLCTDRIDKRIGHGKTSVLSMGVMALSLFGCGMAKSEWAVCALALPLGAASGIIDTAVNDYVSRNYSSKHMSWLHCSWGIGSMLSPFVVGGILSQGGSWRKGYITLALVQAAITILLIISLPWWKKSTEDGKKEEIHVLSIGEVFRKPGMALVLCAFFSYCAGETTAGLWASSYLIETRGFNADIAATCSSAIFMGITVGRFLTSFVANNLGDMKLAKTGGIIAFAGSLLVLIPSSSPILPLAGIFIAGLGCGPLVPSFVHATPGIYGKENSSSIVGVEMAAAHAGSTIMPPLFGVLAERISIRLFPAYISILFFIMMLCILIISGRNSK